MQYDLNKLINNPYEVLENLNEPDESLLDKEASEENVIESVSDKNLFFEMLNKSNDAWNNAMNNDEPVTVADLENEIYYTENTNEIENKEASIGSVAQILITEMAPLLATKTVETAFDKLYTNKMVNNYKKVLQNSIIAGDIDLANSVNKKIKGVKSLSKNVNKNLNSENTNKTIKNIIGSLFQNNTANELENLKTDIYNSLPSDSSVKRVADINDQLKVLGVDSKGYKAINDVYHQEQIAPLQVQQMQNTIINQGLEQQSLEHSIQKSIMENDLLKNKFNRENTFFGRMQNSSLGQIAAPLGMGAAIALGGAAASKILNVASTVNNLVGPGDISTPLIVNIGLEKIYKENPNLRAYSPATVKKFYGLIYKYAEHIAADPIISSKLVERLINYGGNDLAVISEIMKMNESYNNKHDRVLDISNLGKSLLRS